MAVGAVNSMSGTQEQPKVLRIGESVASKVEAIKNPNAKTYYHMIPGAKFVMPDGLEINFFGGQFTTDDADVIVELDRVADRNGTMIFTRKESAEVIKQQASTLAKDAADTAGKAVK